jgi:hypothetical protein
VAAVRVAEAVGHQRRVRRQLHGPRWPPVPQPPHAVVVSTARAVHRAHGPASHLCYAALQLQTISCNRGVSALSSLPVTTAGACIGLEGPFDSCAMVCSSCCPARGRNIPNQTHALRVGADVMVARLPIGQRVRVPLVQRLFLSIFFSVSVNI